MQSPRAQVAPGDRIDDRYDVETLLGAGGMAVVYRAKHAGTRAPCALKLVHSHLVARKELVELFLKEARVGSHIGKSEHIVEVFDAGFDRDRGLPYIAMELLEGETLEEWCERHGPMPPELVAALFEQLGDALDQAHRAGVVHRDLKPSNLFLTSGRRGRPLLKVMDFGIAKVIEAGAQRTATQVGTPAYAAPEQMGPTMRELASRQGISVATSVATATDVWPLALIAYELLTGLPSGQFWGAETAVEIPMKAVLLPRERPTGRAGERAPLLPSGFDAWFLRTTRTLASERWPSAGEAAAELQRLLAPVVPAARLSGASPPRSATLRGAAPVSAAEAAAVAAVLPAAAPPPPEAAPAAAEGAEVAFPPLPAPRGARRRPRWLPFAVGSGVLLLMLLAVVVPRVRRSAAREACRSSGARCEEACDGGDAEGCGLFAARVERGEGGARDPARAAALYEKGCDRGDPGSCAGLGRILRAGVGGRDRDLLRAAALFQRACDAGDARGCALLGEAFRDGAGLGKDLVRATALFQGACDRADSLGCNDLARAVELGLGGLTRDERRAHELHKRACDAALPAGCADLGAFLAVGRGGASRDERAAVALFQRTCDAGEQLGCERLGGMLEQGRGGLGRDEPRALALYRQACDGGEPRGCGSLGALFEAGKGGLSLDLARALALYRKACDAGDPAACRRLAALYEAGKGGLSRDEARAVSFYERACEGGDARGCNDLGFMTENGRGGLARDDGKAARFYERACDAGEPIGCANFGVMLSAGRGVARDEARAVSLYQRACDAGNHAGCAGLGWSLFSSIKSAQRDRTRGLDLLRKACEAGNVWACDRLREAGAR